MSKVNADLTYSMDDLRLIRDFLMEATPEEGDKQFDDEKLKRLGEIASNLDEINATEGVTVIFGTPTD